MSVFRPFRGVSCVGGMTVLALLLSGASASRAQTPSSPAAGTAAAQAAAARLGRSVSDDEIFQAIRRSGLSEQEVRRRLQSAGYDPSLADPFFANSGETVGRTGGAPRPQSSTNVAEALRAIGLLSGASTDENIRAEANDEAMANLTGGDVDTRADSGGVFGRALFGRATTLFDPVTAGPIDASYRLGVGDQVQVVLTGSAEAFYVLDVRRDGNVVLPQVGQVPIAGLTVEAARTVLRQRAGRFYSGISSGQTHLDLSVSRVRSNVVFVTGEVARPGSYQVNALSTAFHALVRAGGPTSRGSFRNIEVRRGGVVVKSLDLYDYLLKGDANADVRTEQGDIVFIPLNTRSVALQGAVRRPALFELKQGEGFTDLLRFSGGLLATAVTDRVQIDRILPMEQRSPGRDRVIIDVPIAGNLDSLSRVAVYDGDIVTVFGIGALRRNLVSLQGEVFQPGRFQYKSGMTLGALMDMAQGTLPWALTDRVKVTRRISETGRSEMVSIDLRDPAGRAFPLQEYDEVVVLDARTAVPTGRVTISGAVNAPQSSQFIERQTLKDLIDVAGGFREDASFVEVARRKFGPEYSDTTSIVQQFAIGPSYALEPQASGFILQRDDRVFVRSSPGNRQQRYFEVSGLFKYPGTYPLVGEFVHLSDAVGHAGGLLPNAYPGSFRLLRSGRPVAVDFDAVLHGDRKSDLLLEENDQLFIGQTVQTVYVGGEVETPSLILYDKKYSLEDYVSRAGGPAIAGDLSRARVQYPSGATLAVRKHRFRPDEVPTVIPGSIITVPGKPAASEGQLKDNIVFVTQVASTLASLAIAFIAIKR
jgi:polysaccharide export outer membrane protein